MARSQRVTAVVVWVVLSLIWGSTWAAIKIGLADLPPIRFACFRFLIALAALGILIAIRKPPTLKREHWKWIAISGLLQFALNYGLIFWAERSIPSGLTAVLQSTIPLFGFVLAHHRLADERLTMRRSIGLLVGIVGVAVIFIDQLTLGSASVFWGSLGVLLSALCAAEASIIVKAKGAGVDNMVLLSAQIAVGLVPLLVFSLLVEGNPLATHWTMSALYAVLYLALVGTVTAFVLYYWLVRHIDVTSTQLISLITPFLAVLLGVLVLRETLNPQTLLGGAGIIGGIAIILRRARPAPTPLSATIALEGEG